MRGRVPLVAGLVGALAVACLLSIGFGALSVPPDQVVRTLLGDAPDARVDTVIWESRVPRTALGLAVGAALGLAGALLQALTRNPLADPGILGISAGAAFGVVLAAGVFGLGTLGGRIWFALAGALVAGVAVYLLGRLGQSGLTPVKLALAGVAVTALLSSLTSGIVLTDPDALNRYRFWAAGSLGGQNAGGLGLVLPLLLVGALLALACAPSLNSLALGEDVATSLGRRVGLVRVQGVLAVTLLTGGAVALIGPVVFVGLVVPHVARILAQRAGIGPDHRWLLPVSAALAPVLLLLADVAGRLVARPLEIQAGVLVAFVGGPSCSAATRSTRG
ncbi:FecCD family ABC transporter permease [Streptomyces hainanensis]|uniref:FecCD family ABC transporter permease n=1 Tax=Streptomyces hainanensis TaxID=402648 RepID=UPI001FB78650|nr:iron chelate uptake ABC transporter family permease subunit [Streptomyces hainanensis]